MKGLGVRLTKNIMDDHTNWDQMFLAVAPVYANNIHVPEEAAQEAALFCSEYLRMRYAMVKACEEKLNG
jgi:hypothetical protein